MHRLIDRWGSGLIDDMRHACRGLAKWKSWTAVLLATLALGIGVNTAVFSVFYAVLMRPLPYADPDRLVVVWASLRTRGAAHVAVSGELFREIAERQRALGALAGIWVTPPRTLPGDPPIQVKNAYVTSNFFRVLGVDASVGRTFADRDGGGPVAIVSDAIWQQHFSGDPALVGKAVGDGTTIVGILPRSFQLHFAPDANVPGDVQVFQPWGEDFQQGRNYIVRAIARLKAGTTRAQAQADLDRVAADIRATSPQFENERLRFIVTGLQEDAYRDVRIALSALFAGGGFVLLICVVNVTSVLLARASERRREIAFRLALGATRWRIARQLLAEALVLSAAGGLCGVGVGWGIFRALVALRPDRLARVDEPHLVWPVMAYTAVASAAATIVFALAPAFQSRRVADAEALRGRGASWLTRVQRRAGGALVVGEMALGSILVAGSMLSAQTLFNVERVRPGFDAPQLLAFQLPGMPPRAIDEWQARFASIPGVERVGAISHLPFDTTLPNWYGDFRTRDDRRLSLTVDNRGVTPGYLETMGVRLREGRFFTAQDGADSRAVVIVDDTLARAVWPGDSALGKSIDAEHMTTTGTPFEFVPSVIVGVVEHVHHHSLTNEVRPQIYSPFAQNARDSFPQTFVLRTTVPPLSIVAPVREALRERDPRLAMGKVQPMMAYVDREIAPVAFTAILAAIFGGLALVLAATGVYGVLSYQVSRRIGEIGTRMALGATGRAVLGLVMRETVWLASAGLLLGVAASYGVARAGESLLFGVSAHDPIALAATVLLLPAAALVGCWRPAWRAARTNPVDLIRAE